MLCMGTRAPAAAAATRAPGKATATADSLISLELLTGPSRYAVPLLSPDGRLLSFMAPVDGALNLWVGPATAPDSARPLTHERGRGLQPWDVSGKVLYRWNASGTRLLYPRDTNGNEQWQLYSLDVRTGQEKSLTSLKGGSVRVIEMSAEHPNQALIGINDRDPRRFDPWLLDIETGKLDRLEQNDRFAGYYADHDLKLRLAIAVGSTGSYEIYRRIPAGTWEKFYEVPMEETAQSRAIGTDGANREFYAYDSHGRTPRRSSRATSNRARCGCCRGREERRPGHPAGSVTRGTGYASNFTRLGGALDPRWPRT
jgi:hypothetical protein